MASLQALRTAVERFQDHAGATTVYGTPIEHGEKTIVPVARVAYGFGWGYGPGPGGDDDPPAGLPDDEQGGGMGGGVWATPAGVVEVTDEATRFVPAADVGRRALLAGACLLLGYLLGRR